MAARDKKKRDCKGFCHRTESFIVIDSLKLVITFRNKSRLSALKLKTHFTPSTLEEAVGWTRVHVFVRRRALNSASMAERHSRCFEASV